MQAKNRSIAFILIFSLTALLPTDAFALKAGASRRDVSFSELLGGAKVHVPLYARVLDDGKRRVAIICVDLIRPWFEEVREKIRTELGFSMVLVNCSHTHADGHRRHNPNWCKAVGEQIFAAAEEAFERRVPVTLHRGRSPVVIGHNRYGKAFTQEIVPWVNVLEARGKNGNKVAVLFEHPAHPVLTMDAPGGLSADFPGYAIARVEEQLGGGVVAMFANGCAGNTNAEPVYGVKSGWYENAGREGHKLGDAVLAAIRRSIEIKSKTFTTRTKKILLPLRVPTAQQWAQQMARLNEANPGDVAMLQSQLLLPKKVDPKNPPALEMEINAVMFDSEWCLVTTGGEPFTEYELWIDAVAPFERTMVFGYTNDVAKEKEKHYSSYLLTDRALALSIKHPHQASRFCRDAHRMHDATTHEDVRLPYAVGLEGVIKSGIKSLWEE